MWRIELGTLKIVYIGELIKYFIRISELVKSSHKPPQIDQEEAENFFGVDSGFCPKVSEETLWGGIGRYVRPSYSYVNPQENFMNGKQLIKSMWINNNFTSKVKGKSIFTYQTASFNVLYNGIRMLARNNTKFEIILKQWTSTFSKLILEPKSKENVYIYRMETFQSLKGFGADDVNLDCSFHVEGVYKAIFSDFPEFIEHNYCHSCLQRFSTWNIVQINTHSLENLLENLEKFKFECSCGSTIIKALKTVLTVSVSNYNLETECDDDCESYLEVKVKNIPRNLKIFGENYLVKSVVAIKGTKKDSYHYTCLNLDPITDRWQLYDCFKSKPSVIPGSNIIKPVLFIAIKQ